MNKIERFVQRHSLMVFFMLACAPIWIIVSLHLSDALALILSTLAPTLAALILISATEGRAGLSALCRQAFIWRVKPVWIIAAILIPALCVLLPIAVADLLAPETYEAAPITAANQAVIGGVFIFAFLEELGWMGYAMPRVIKHQTPLAAALIVGLVQGIYHFPVLLLSDSPLSIVTALTMTMSFRVLMTWIYLPTRGSVLIAALFHGVLNLVSSFVVAGINPAYFNLVYSSGFVIAAVILVLVTGRNLQRQLTQAGLAPNDRHVVEQS